MVWEKYYRIHSKMTYSQRSNVFGPHSLLLCHDLSRFSVSSSTCHHRRRDKSFFRKLNFKIHFGTYNYLNLMGKIIRNYKNKIHDKPILFSFIKLKLNIWLIYLFSYLFTIMMWSIITCFFRKYIFLRRLEKL